MSGARTAASTAYERVLCRDGSFTLKSGGSSEPMHSHLGPWREAREVYLAQARLEIRLRGDRPLVVWDVGLGIGANALALLEACESAPHRGRPLHLISFENDLSPIRQALNEADAFDFVLRNKFRLNEVLEAGCWYSPESSMRWELREGSFLDPIAGMGSAASPAPELIFYDFYSPKVNAELWGLQAFTQVFKRCASDALLITYAASTAVRTAMLLAGFHVGYGVGTDSKSETTVAARRLDDLARPLDPRWLQRVLRSSKPLPQDILPNERESALRRIQSAPQFV